MAFQPHFKLVAYSAVPCESTLDERTKQRVNSKDLQNLADDALRRSRLNPNLAAAQYFGGRRAVEGSWHFLLPLQTHPPEAGRRDDAAADAALVIAPLREGAYVAKAVITVETARCNARVCAPLDHPWLTPSGPSGADKGQTCA